MTESINKNCGTSERRLDGIDLLRGLCVLLVVMHHIHLRFWLNDYDVDSVLPKRVTQVLFWSGSVPR